MANEKENQNQGSNQALAVRVEVLESRNVALTSVIESCLEVLLESAMMGQVRRAREGFIKAAQEKLAGV